MMARSTSHRVLREPQVVARPPRVMTSNRRTPLPFWAHFDLHHGRSELPAELTTARRVASFEQLADERDSHPGGGPVSTHLPMRTAGANRVLRLLPSMPISMRVAGDVPI